MLEFSDATIFNLVLLGGAISVGVFAFRLFENPNYEPYSKSYAILNTIPLAMLGGRKSYFRGLITYLLVFEGAYLILSSSTVIFNLAISVVPETSLVGPVFRDLPNSDLVNSLNPIFPLASATFITTLTTIKPISDIESVIRRVAHHAAGIPQNIYEVISKIKRFQLQVVAKDAGPVIYDAHLIAERCVKCMQELGVSTNIQRELSENILRSIGLFPWIGGYQSGLIWDQRYLSSLSATVDMLRQRVDILREKLQDDDAISRFSRSDWERIREDSRTLADDVIALFAVLNINQERVQVQNDAPVLKKLIHEIRSERSDSAFNTLLGAVVIGTFFGIFTTVALGIFKRYYLFSADNAATETSLDLTTIVMEIQYTLPEVFRVAFLLVIGATIGINLRAAQIDLGVWRRWGDGDYPFIQYVWLGLLTYVMVFPIYLIYEFVLVYLGQENFNFFFLKEYFDQQFIVQILSFCTPVIFVTWVIGIIEDTTPEHGFALPLKALFWGTLIMLSTQLLLGVQRIDSSMQNFDQELGRFVYNETITLINAMVILLAYIVITQVRYHRTTRQQQQPAAPPGNEKSGEAHA